MAAGRILSLIRSRAAGAVVAQVWQAVGSFGLQIVASWTLGAQGLGLISLSLGVIVLATALASGMIGDSLVILDRSRPSIRGALQTWAIVIGLVSGTVAGIGMGLTALTPFQALLFAGALMAFQFEELIRRVFMGVMQFWRLVILDSVAVGTALAIITVFALTHSITVEAFFAALLVGQLAGILVGIILLPREERIWLSMRGASLRYVASFGAWRGAQVAVPQVVLTVSRVLVTAFAGGAALGMVEGARIFVAPVLLTVQGLGSYLLSSYVRDSELGIAALRRRARQTSLMMMSGALLLGVAIVAAAPYLGHLISGPSFQIQRLTVIGWVVYVMATASFQPFASLAAVKGGQRRVFGCRVIDASFAIAVLTAMLASGVSPDWTPFALAAGLFFGGLLVRRFVLTPLSQSPISTSVTEPRMSHV
ncbi:MAG: hypothetical protein VB080_15730 [Propionicimonas sp.]|uniref:hypothetical protein n=1 Tax=Propionicimonas sp. TaxID=1955623 RepID=UPI002B1FEB41|nr:hypothetical protein [Propionicimonas sp.]MEA4945871.1 hypothetical protein [Propionicimonas sp.]MEA5053977.1 hypothetical protein [Propionicimonas sp.]MEA5116810.1 hypothetical protein [Propionicimonas sp.]